MYVSPYGKPEGLAERLDKWASDLSKNSTYPWAGLGLIADLKLAAATLSGRPVEEKPAPTLEFDL